jgi:hypothetical protein
MLAAGLGSRFRNVPTIMHTPSRFSDEEIDTAGTDHPVTSLRRSEKVTAAGGRFQKQLSILCVDGVVLIQPNSTIIAQCCLPDKARLFFVSLKVSPHFLSDIQGSAPMDRFEFSTASLFDNMSRRVSKPGPST